jgi:2-oxoglutarate/2-oxoacid ferredoxin oxidoreductase subunit alpha
MTELREKKIQKVADDIPDQGLIGDETGDLLVVSWGGTRGAVTSAVLEMQKEGKKISLAHFHHIMPLPKNTDKILGGFKKILVCELNAGQFVQYLRMNFPQYKYSQFNKVQGLPFIVSELVEAINQKLKEV